MRKLVYAFYNDGFSFASFLRKYPEHRVSIINLLIGNVFREDADEVYGPMSEFASIPRPLYEPLAPSPIPKRTFRQKSRRKLSVQSTSTTTIAQRHWSRENLD